jgi:carbon-monoxide dehydrogenase medium subunit
VIDVSRYSRPEYVKVLTVDDAIEELIRNGEAYVVAGGTDLVVNMRLGRCAPRKLVDLSAVPQLSVVSPDHNSVVIGATATMSRIVEALSPWPSLSALTTAASLLGTPQVRNLATIGGNIGNASPSAELVGPLVALGASAVLRGPKGDRCVPIEELFVGPGETVLSKSEVLTAVDVPIPPTKTLTAYARHRRTRVDLATVGVSVALGVTAGRCQHCRVVLTAVAPTPLRAIEAEGVLAGQKLTEEVIAQAALVASAEARPISDVRASADYRRELVEIITRRSLTSLAATLGVN